MAILAVLFSATVSVAGAREAGNYPRARKLSNAPWLSAPHFPALSKRGRFVFRQAASPQHHDDSAVDHDLDSAETSDHQQQLLDKRNWRL
jgi:hypothetical protein